MINKWTAISSVNAGMCLSSGDLRIWIDAVHDRKVQDFSSLTPQRQRFLFESPDFRDPDVIFFTHMHPDHYSKELCERAMELYPQAHLIAPELCHERQMILLNGDEMIIPLKNKILTFHRLVHEGEQYRDVPHYGLMIEDEGERILVLGDCALRGSGLEEWISGMSIDTAFVTFPWVSLSEGRDFLVNILKPEQLMVYHFPLAEDDKYGYVKAARKAAGQLKSISDIRLFVEAFQREEL